MTLPINPISGTEYQGKNIALLLAAQDDSEYPLPHWVTYLQAKDKGGQVRKGEHGVRCIKMVTLQDKETKKKFARPRGFTLFNVAQVDWDSVQADQ